MGRIQSTRITADTNVQSASPCVYNGFILRATGGSAAGTTISVYADNTGTGTTNLLVRYSISPPNTSTTIQYHYTDGLLCRSGLRIECDDWTDLEMFVLHS
jgi:hypothetical protein